MPDSYGEGGRFAADLRDDSGRPRRLLKGRLSAVALIAGAVVIVVAAVAVLLWPPDYRNELPASWADGCLGEPEVITEVFADDSFSSAGISHGRSLDDPWYECSWTWAPGGSGGGHQTIRLEIKVLGGDEFDDYDRLIATVRSEGWDRIESASIAGFDSGFCTSSMDGVQHVCRGADSNLQVVIMATGGDDEIGRSGIAIEDYLAEVGSYIQEQLAR